MARDRTTSYLYRGIAAAIVLAGLVIFFAGYIHDTLLIMVLGVGVLLGGGILGQRGERHGLEDADELCARDKRRKILYLRSFRDEAEENRIVNGLTAMFDRAIGGAELGWGRAEQQTLAAYFKRIGPYITVGRPGETLPDVGAAWKWIPDKLWKKEVGKLIRDSRLIVVGAGRTDGLRWELEYLVKNVDPKKILLIVPRRKRDYQEFREWAAAILPGALPGKIPRGLLVMFDKSWQPEVLGGGQDLLENLYPFFKQNGIDSPRNAVQAYIQDRK